jgi:nucleoside-diphosphate-sugar epimerase
VFLGQVLSGEPITIHGSGNQTRTLTYIDDEADGIVAAIQHPDVVNETINISTEESLSVFDWAKIIMRVVGKEVPIIHVTDRVGQTFVEKIDASKAKWMLDWQTKVSFEEGIKRTYEWMQQCWKENV